MSKFTEEQVLTAFRIYSELAFSGMTDEKSCRLYMTDHEVRYLVQLYAEEVDCVLFTQGGESLVMIPKAVTSPFHVTNESIKREHFGQKGVNLDIYMMYVTIIILFGLFYDSYQTQEPTRSFLPVSEWLDEINARMSALMAMEEGYLKKADGIFEYNWSALCEKWDALNEVRDGVKADGRSTSKRSLLNTTIQFLIAQDLVEFEGEEEVALTLRAQGIISHYFMDQSYNRSILSFLYGQDTIAETIIQSELKEV